MNNRTSATGLRSPLPVTDSITELAANPALLLERLAQEPAPVWREVHLTSSSLDIVPGQAA